MCHAANPAGMREPFAEQAEIGVHDWEVRKRGGGFKRGHAGDAGWHITMRSDRAEWSPLASSLGGVATRHSR
jgi:hypothetical protein